MGERETPRAGELWIGLDGSVRGGLRVRITNVQNDEVAYLPEDSVNERAWLARVYVFTRLYRRAEG